MTAKRKADETAEDGGTAAARAAGDSSRKKSKRDKKKQPKKTRSPAADVHSAAADGTEAQAEAEDSAKPEIDPENHPALLYLRQWHSDRDNWKFHKLRQVYLIKNAYDPYKIKKPDFKILVKYFAGLQGGQRQTMLDEARSIVDSEEAPPEDEAQRVLSQIKTHRATKLLNALG
eukprot:m.300632 g.300632  ORF g.300632 m.300632 type:complete len:174 (+) comp14511_c0_seq1:69-590(+)